MAHERERRSPPESHDSGTESRTHDAAVERLARELGDAVGHAPERERDEIQDYAIELLRDEAEDARHAELERTVARRRRPLGTFGLVVLLVVAGVALLVVLPPVGIVLLLLAVPLTIWGVAETIFSRERPPSPPAR